MTSEHQDMWTPLERAFAPFKSLARLNRQSVKVGSEFQQMRLDPDRCRVEPASGQADAPSLVQVGFAIASNQYTVRLSSADYSRGGVWNLDMLCADLSAALTSGALVPGDAFVLSTAVSPER